MDGLGRYEVAAVLAGHSVNVFTYTAAPELMSVVAHLREVLGEGAYESLTTRGKHMATADIVRYAFDQIDLARAELG